VENIVHSFFSGHFYVKSPIIINIRRILVFNILFINYLPTLDHEQQGEQNSYQKVYFYQMTTSWFPIIEWLPGLSTGNIRIGSDELS